MKTPEMIDAVKLVKQTIQLKFDRLIKTGFFRE